MPPDTATELRPQPAFLRALDHVLQTPDGWISQCPVFGCPDLLIIEPGDDRWQFTCEGQHTHEDVVGYLQCDTSLQDYLRRVWRSTMLAPSLEVCRALLRGEHVPRSALDPLWRRRFGL